MYLKKLSLTNFKNYEFNELEFSPKINCFVGNNGVGKTNILDSIHYLSLTKSFFNTRDGENIKHGADYFIVQGQFVTKEEEDKIHCAFQKHKQKSFKRNGKEYQRLSDHVGRYPVVMISPSDSSLILEGSDERRKFLNKIISQYNIEYLDNVLKYTKALQQRNKQLKEFKMSGRFNNDLITIWDAQLVKYGNYIFKERDSVINELIPVFQEYYDIISSAREKINLRYKSHLSEGDFMEELVNSVNRDRQLEFTTVGVHKDDLLMEMNDFNIKAIGSQGQQKSYLVALKLAKFEYIKKKSGLLPILLLDDIFDKFDAERVEQIIKLVGTNHFGQIFITDTHRSRLQDVLSSNITDYKLFNISDNIIAEI